MSNHLKIHRAGPGVSVQDQGRSGCLDSGLSRGGAADRLALAEAAALLGRNAGPSAIEMAGMGGEFEVSEDTRIALTGAPMQASLDGVKLAWNASHLMPAGARLIIGAALTGTYGYLSFGGGLKAPEVLGAQSAHLAAGVGRALQAGDTLPLGSDAGDPTSFCLTPSDRCGGGTIRMVASFQTRLFPQETRDRFEATEFRRDARGNRMGVRLDSDGEGFPAEGGRTVLSEVIVPGDIQITGDGVPVILMAECQTTGGYPRIGTVLAADMARAAQAPAGAALDCRFITIEEGLEIERTAATQRAGLARATRPLLRDPRDIADLLSYRLVDGAVSGYEEEEEEDER